MFSSLRSRLGALKSSPVAITALVNLFGVAATMFTGIVLARSLGDVGRGMYAGVVSWFTAALVVGEVGQSAAVTFFTARRPSDASRVVLTGRRATFTVSAALMCLAVTGAPVLSNGDPELTWAFRIIFIGVGLNGLLGPYIYALQALSLRTWNRIRLVQPIANLAAVGLWCVFADLTVIGAAVCLLGSYLVQLVAGRISFRAVSDRRVSPNSGSLPGVLNYGLRQSASSVPESVARGLDRIILSQAVGPGVLGQYAVAQSVISAAAPLGTAISSVMFPRMAAFDGANEARRVLEVKTLKRTLATLVIASGLLLIISPWAIPVVFGDEFSDSVQYSWWIAPAIVAQGVLGVCLSLLRGRGRPGLASSAAITSLVVGGAMMVGAVRILGAGGAGAGALVGALAGLGVALFCLRSRRDTVVMQ